MAVNLSKVLEMISRDAAIAQGNKSFGHLRPKTAKLGIEDGDELGDGHLDGLPSTSMTPGAALNSKVQGEILAHQDHELPDTEELPGEDPEQMEDAPDEKQAPRTLYLGTMSTNAPKIREAHGIQETAKRRRGRPRGSKA